MNRTSSWAVAGLAFAVLAVAWTSCQTTSNAMATKDVMVGLERTACHGRCPVYALSVSKTGEAALTVGNYCEEVFGRSLELGNHRATVDVETWRTVVDMAMDMGFDTLKSTYDDPRIMDVPSNILTVDGKTVFNRIGGPRLNLIYMRIEELVGATDWKPDPAVAR